MGDLEAFLATYNSIFNKAREIRFLTSVLSLTFHISIRMFVQLIFFVE